ncbi:hypothetical protein PQQ51_08295 [Paraburkholderia xenovorans]|uniref:hypothetical protein n=1 Tax=Paraburkholderia xenovorans TaxID=36873 RepID=UPI0038B823FD
MVASSALFVMSIPAMAASGGTITFSGMIVAPQLEIQAPVAAAAGTPGARVTRTGSAVQVAFNAPAGVASGADVALRAADGADMQRAVDARFRDSRGRLVGAARDGSFHVGADGGVLAVSPRADASSATPPVVVVVNFD